MSPRVEVSSPPLKLVTSRIFIYFLSLLLLFLIWSRKRTLALSINYVSKRNFGLVIQVLND